MTMALPCQVPDYKRPHLMMSAEDVKGAPRLSLATTLPLHVWQDHLVTVLRMSEAARLRGVCKALRGVATKCPMQLRGVSVHQLKEALTCFPAAESLEISSVRHARGAAEEEKVMEVLRAYGGRLKQVKGDGMSPDRVILSAIRVGALPNVNSLSVKLCWETPQKFMADGLLGRLPLEELQVIIGKGDSAQLRLLEQLRHLPFLRRLSMSGCQGLKDAFPPFIPPSLKALTLDITSESSLDLLLRDCLLCSRRVGPASKRSA
jgi:hypothetical protein